MTLSQDLLIAEELMLLLLADDGRSISAAGTLHYPLGGALLVELALIGRVELDETSGGFVSGPIVRPLGNGPLGDPLLQSAYDTVVERPRRVQTLLALLGADLWSVLLERLEQRGVIRREKAKFLGIVPTTRYPADDGRPETALRNRILDVLVHEHDPDARTAAVIGLVYASGAMPALRPPLPWNSTTVQRAQQLRDGDWGAAAVGKAVERTALAVATGTATAVAVAVSAGSSGSS